MSRIDVWGSDYTDGKEGFGGDFGFDDGLRVAGSWGVEEADDPIEDIIEDLLDSLDNEIASLEPISLEEEEPELYDPWNQAGKENQDEGRPAHLTRPLTDNWELTTPPAADFKGRKDPYSQYRKARHKVQIVSVPALNFKTGIDWGANHVGAYDPWSGKYFDGMSKSSGGKVPEIEVTPDFVANSPKRTVDITNGMTGEEFIHGLHQSGEFNQGLWFGSIYDCHVELKNAFEKLDQHYPGSPEGRLDWDEQLENLFNWIYTEAYKRIIGKFNY